MKFLILLLLSFHAFGSNWMPISKIQSQSVQAYGLEKECINRSQEQCIDVGDAPQIIQLGMFELQDHYLKSNTTECESDCEDEFSELTCDDESFEKIKNTDLSQVYCTKLAGKKLIKDEQSYANHLNAIQSQNAAMNLIQSMRNAGQEVINLMILRNAQKQLTSEQKMQILTEYSIIKALLEVGNLAQAKTEIENAQLSAIVTQQDKDALIAKINTYLGI